MRKSVLIIGGTGQISLALTRHLHEQGHEITIFNRGHRKVRLPEGVHVIHGDREDTASLAMAASAYTYDVVFDFICWNEHHAELDVQLFTGRCAQFFYISTAWVYGPPETPMLKESHPRRPVEGYGRSKYAAEEVFLKASTEEGFPSTIIRFHATYDDDAVVGGILSGDQTPLYRMMQGKPIMLHDRGTLFTQFLHADDAAFALDGLMQRSETSIGQAYNVAGDPVTWRDYYIRLGRTFGLSPAFISIPSELLIHWTPECSWPLMGVHQFQTVLDSHKLFATLDGLEWRITIESGFRRNKQLLEQSREGFRSDPDPKMTERLDALIEQWGGVISGTTTSFDDAGWRRWMERRS